VVLAGGWCPSQCPLAAAVGTWAAGWRARSPGSILPHDHLTSARQKFRFLKCLEGRNGYFVLFCIMYLFYFLLCQQVQLIVTRLSKK